MKRRAGRTCRAGAVVVATSLWCSGVYAQQSLALSYKLEVRKDAAQSAPALVNRCSGFNWLASVGACGRDLLARVGPAVGRLSRAESPTADDGAADESPGAAVGATAHSAEPAEAAGSVPRAAYAGANRAPDLLLRLGSRHRLRGNDEAGWNSYRFTDTTYQTHLQTHGHKALGVELHVPFQ